MSYAAQLTDHYAGIRSRLMGTPRRVEIAIALPAPTEPPRVSIEAMPPEMLEGLPTKGAPLNLLSPCSWQFLLALTTLRSGISRKQILGRSRSREIVAARRDALALIYQHTQASMPVVGRLFGRDHTTVLHQLRKAGATVKLVELTPYTQGTTRSQAVKYQPPKPAAQPRKRTALQNAVVRAYKHNIPPSALAEEYGCNPRSVKVIAHHLGLKRSDFNGKAKAPALEAIGQ